MIDLDPLHLETIKRILAEYVPDCEALVFGSRARGTAAAYSDLDIALVSNEKLDWRRIEALKDAFAESDLPIIVDPVDWHSISDSFRAIIESKHEVLKNRQ
ncbi:MAG: nucleotidyltransferase domain-containing protein [Armatimonadota bacterium]|nr:nucleotidyltransferase domain-containing protein [Armatimonadota bacterium]